MNEAKPACPCTDCSSDRSSVSVRVGHSFTFGCSASISFSFIPHQVHQCDTKLGSSLLSSTVEQNSHERINICEEAILCVHPLVPVDNLASSQDAILQKNALILFLLKLRCSVEDINTLRSWFCWLTTTWLHLSHSWKEWGLLSCFCWDEASSIQLFHSFKCLRSKTPSKAYSLSVRRDFTPLYLCGPASPVNAA